MKKIVKVILISVIGIVLTIGTMGLYNYFKGERS